MHRIFHTEQPVLKKKTHCLRHLIPCGTKGQAMRLFLQIYNLMIQVFLLYCAEGKGSRIRLLCKQSHSYIPLRNILQPNRLSDM